MSGEASSLIGLRLPEEFEDLRDGWDEVGGRLCWFSFNLDMAALMIEPLPFASTLPWVA